MITLKAFNASLKSVSNTTTAIQTIAAYAIQQAAIGDNLDAMIRALSAPIFRDQRDNTLNKVGIQLRNYITAHYKAVVIKMDKSDLTIKFKKERDTHLVDVLASREKGERIYQAAPIVDGVNLCDFKAFTDYSESKAPKTVQPLTLKQLETRLFKIAGDLEVQGLALSLDELKEATVAITVLHETLLAKIATAKITNDAVETTALEKVEGVKPSAKSKSAGKKKVAK